MNYFVLHCTTCLGWGDGDLSQQALGQREVHPEPVTASYRTKQPKETRAIMLTANFLFFLSRRYSSKFPAGRRRSEWQEAPEQEPAEEPEMEQDQNKAKELKASAGWTRNTRSNLLLPGVNSD